MAFIQPIILQDKMYIIYSVIDSNKGNKRNLKRNVLKPFFVKQNAIVFVFNYEYFNICDLELKLI